MSLKAITKILAVVIISVFVASCTEDNYDEYVVPTYEEEMANLTEYIDTLENRGLDVDTTSLGVYYVIDSIGNGVFPVDGDTCIVKYTGFLIGGSIFDSTYDDTFEFVLGTDGFIEGWNDGMRMVDEEGKAYLIIPSSLGYGSTGYYSIEPYQTLIFSIEMIDIKQGF
jgi:FKBP-type peptidyl-prolyl cis-trans isomerase